MFALFGVSLRPLTSAVLRQATGRCWAKDTRPLSRQGSGELAVSHSLISVNGTFITKKNLGSRAPLLLQDTDYLWWVYERHTLRDMGSKTFKPASEPASA